MIRQLITTTRLLKNGCHPSIRYVRKQCFGCLHNNGPSYEIFLYYTNNV